MKVRVGEVYRVNTFAGVEVHMKIISIDDEARELYTGVLVRPEDVTALRNASVPYKKNESPETCEGWVFGFQVKGRVTNQTRRGKVVRRPKSRKKAKGEKK